MTPISISDLDPARPIHLAGIGGSAMSGLALLLRQRGFEITGTDPRRDEGIERLVRAGIRVYRKQDGVRIPEDAGLIIASVALPSGHAELASARERGIPVVTYPEFLGALMAEKTGVAVAGTHGKTTVSSMVTWCLRAAGIEPSFVIGGFVPGFNASAGSGTSDIFVAEACEYNRSFLNLYPRIAVITNVEADHLDVYGDLEAVKEAFRAFVSHLPAEDGVLIYDAACRNTPSVFEGLSCRKVSYAVDRDADVAARNLQIDSGGTTFNLVVHGETAGRVATALPGRHNVANSLAAIAVCRALGVAVEKSAAAIATFSGVRRRFDIRGEAAGVTVVDDYAHHPTELRALLDAAREKFPGRRTVLAFQPHQFSRTRLLMDDFARALSAADQVLVPNIYFARDNTEDRKRVSAGRLVDKVRESGPPARHLGTLDALKTFLIETLESGDVLITAGAGDIDTVVEPVLSGLRQRKRRCDDKNKSNS